MKILGSAEILSALLFSHVVPELENVFKRDCRVLQRHIHSPGTDDADHLAYAGLE